MKRQIAKVLWIHPITPVVFQIGLSCQEGYDHTVPGQFVMVRPVDQKSPLLSRPFSIYSLITTNKTVTGIELLIKVIGRGTENLAGLKKGAEAALLGPLGNGFDIFSDNRRYFLVAGGIGVAPLVFLAKAMMSRGIAPDQCEVFIGGRSSEDLLGVEQLNTLKVPLHLITEDGSAGEKGLVTSLLEKIIASRRPDLVYTCGPWAMMAAVAAITEAQRIPCQVSVETMMGCGMGICLSCVIHARDAATPYRHACMDGPVMDTRQIRF